LLDRIYVSVRRHRPFVVLALMIGGGGCPEEAENATLMGRTCFFGCFAGKLNNNNNVLIYRFRVICSIHAFSIATPPAVFGRV